MGIMARLGRFVVTVTKFVLSIGLVAWLAVCAFLWCKQDMFLYPSDSMAAVPHHAFGPFQEASLEIMPGMTLRFLEVAPQAGKPVLMFLHGNGDMRLVEAGMHSPRLLEGILNKLAKQGYGVVIAEFEGYAGNPGHRGEVALVRDAHAYAAHIRREWPGSPLVLWGESMGTGTAVGLATDTRVEGIVLDAPFTSLAEVAELAIPMVPARFLITGRFDSLARMPTVTAPVFVMHGDLDRLIPSWMGHRIYEAASCQAGSLFMAEASHTVWTTDRTGQAGLAVERFMARAAAGELPACEQTR